MFEHRYQVLDKIGEGGMGAVYRAHDRLSGQRVALKRVTVDPLHIQHSSIGSSTMVRLSLAQEFRTLATLRHPHIISVLDYGFDANNQPYFTMELLDNARTIVEAALDEPFDVREQFLIQLLQALSYLHRRGVLHRDLKPANVLVMPDENGVPQVKVLDFGLAAPQGQVQAEEEEDQVAGTIAYMPPELLHGEPASIEADLYAVGVIAYEMFSGKYPYDSNNIASLIFNIVNQEVDFSPFIEVPEIEAVIARLVAKQADDRYQSAESVISALRLDTMTESESIRESFLQAARFVGRDAEIRLLSDALSILLMGTGSAWLLGGESGVGKSRLLDELKTLAMVGHHGQKGALALRGQTVSEGGQPYQVWRAPLRYLCLQSDLTTLEAGVLKPLVPDIEALTGKPVPDAPELEPQAARERLSYTIETIFKKQTEPVLLILEDLHWAGEESLAVLKRLQRAITRQPLMIVASYRDDERPNLTHELPDFQLMQVKRLSEASIQELSASILGDVGRQPQVVDLLRRETEGNIFFIVEVVRALAEETGQLADIGRVTLPEKVVVGGMHAVIQRRLSRVPESARPLLDVAAVIGRALDLTLLHAISPQTDLDDWLLECSNAAVLDVGDQGGFAWRFSHDKLRETILSDMPQPQLQSLHKQVAEAIERTYPDQPDSIPLLAHHWTRAGDTVKAAYYTLRAGEQALHNGVLQEAERLLRQTIKLQEQTTIPVVEQVRARRLLVESLHSLGRLAEGIVVAEEMLKIAGYEVPDKPLALWGYGLRRLAHFLAYPVRRTLNIKPMHPDIMTEVALGSHRLGELYIWASSPKVLPSSLAMLDIMQDTNSIPALLRLYSGMGYTASILNISFLANYFWRKADEVHKQNDNLEARSAYFWIKGVLNMSKGKWREAQSWFVQGEALSREIGSIYEWLNHRAQHVMALMLTGDHEGTRPIVEEMMDTIERSGITRYLLWGMGTQATIHMRQGNALEAVPIFAELEDKLHRSGDGTLFKFLMGQQALAYARCGDISRAIEIADTRLQSFRDEQGIPVYGGPEDIPALVETYMLLWQDDGNIEFQRRVLAALEFLRKYAKLYPACRSRLYLWEGYYAHYTGKHDDAQRLWKQSLEVSTALNLAYDQTLARRALKENS